MSELEDWIRGQLQEQLDRRLWSEKDPGEAVVEPQEYIDHMRKILAGDVEPEYEDLEDIISFDNFSWADWLRDEKSILEPQLVALGYTQIHWSMGEYDSFGPLTRTCIAKDEDDKIHWFIYG